MIENIYNSLQNKELSALSQQAGKYVTNAIYGASQNTGVDFSYLMQQAAAESSFDSNAKAKTSSATGLYQFIEKTWMGMIKEHGHKYGLGNLSEHVNENFKVEDKSIKEQILNLRNDPKIASAMAAEFASDNKKIMEKAGVEDIGSTELYFSHFLGPVSASKFLLAFQDNPKQLGAEMFPAAAGANKRVFFNANGTEKTLDEIYNFFNKKFSIEENENINIANNDNSEVNYGSHSNISDLYSEIYTADKSGFGMNPSNMGGGWEALAHILLKQESLQTHSLLMMLQEENNYSNI